MSCTDKNKWKRSTPIDVLVLRKVLSQSVSKQNVFQSLLRGVNNSLISQKYAYRQKFLARWLVASLNDQNKKRNVSKANQGKKMCLNSVWVDQCPTDLVWNHSRRTLCRPDCRHWLRLVTGALFTEIICDYFTQVSGQKLMKFLDQSFKDIFQVRCLDQRDLLHVYHSLNESCERWFTEHIFPF